MAGRERIDGHRRRVVVAIGISVGLHAAALAFLHITVPDLRPADRARPLRIVDLPDRWEESAIEIVPLETAILADASGAAPQEDAAVASGPTGAEVVATGALPRPEALSTSMAPSAVNTARASAAPAIEIELARANRGVIKRSGSGTAETHLEFAAASEAARRSERERDSEWSGGDPRGGISIIVPGMGGACAGGGIPIVIQPSGGLGGVPTTGKGRGIIGARPPGGEAINRFGPRVRGGG